MLAPFTWTLSSLHCLLTHYLRASFPLPRQHKQEYLPLISVTHSVFFYSSVYRHRKYRPHWNNHTDKFTSYLIKKTFKEGLSIPLMALVIQTIII